MALTEKEYNDLYKFTLSVASKYVGYKDCAYDIAQNTMLSFISAKTEINKPFSWLKIAVRREAAKYLINEKKETESIPQKAKIEVAQPIANEEESDEILKVNIQKIRAILSKQDFEIYKKLKAVGFSPIKYAEKEKVLLTTVKTYKKRIKKNIEAAILFQDGWRDGNKILNYAQYNSICRFINQILDSVHNGKLSDLKNYLQRIDKDIIYNLFKDVESCYEWHVIYSDNEYLLTLVCTPLLPMPIIIRLNITFNRLNYISITSAKQLIPHTVAKYDGHDLYKYKEKGQIKLSSEQLIAIVTNKKTNI